MYIVCAMCERLFQFTKTLTFNVIVTANAVYIFLLTIETLKSKTITIHLVILKQQKVTIAVSIVTYLTP